MNSVPNILWVTLESVRADHTSLYGYGRRTTPHLDQLASRPKTSVLNHGVAASMWTPASSASMLTGTHLSTHQVGRDGTVEEKLTTSVQTLPELLSAEDFKTALFTSNIFIGPETGLDRGFDKVEILPMTGSNLKRFDSVSLDSWRSAIESFVADPSLRPHQVKRQVANSHNRLLEKRFSRYMDGSSDSDDPFFVYTHIQSPHHPYRPFTEFLDGFFSDVEMNPSEARELSERIYEDISAIRSRIAYGLDLSDEEFAAIEALYDAEIKYADTTAGNLISTAEDVSDRPLVVVVTGDHGDLFGEYGLIGHNLALHDGLIDIPMMTMGIEGVEDSEVSLSQHIDLTYTLAAIAGIRKDQFEGRDLRDRDRPYAISQRGDAPIETYLSYNSDFDMSRFFPEPVTSVRTAEWKYLQSESGAALYRLPEEECDLIDEHPDVVAELSSVLDDESIDWTPRERGEEVDFGEDAKSRLEDLGYLT